MSSLCGGIANEGTGRLGRPGSKNECLLPNGTIRLGLRVLGYVCTLRMARSDRPDECGSAMPSTLWNMIRSGASFGHSRRGD